MTGSDRLGSKVFEGARRGWWLEDALPGSVIRHPGGRTVGAGEHVWLAWITHNVSAVHGDAAAAARSEWGEPLVVGTLTVAIVIGLAQPAAGPEHLAAGRADGWRSIRLERAVVAGDTIRAESHVRSVVADPRAGSGLVERTIIGRNQRGDVVTTIVEQLSVMRRRKLPPPGSEA